LGNAKFSSSTYFSSPIKSKQQSWVVTSEEGEEIMQKLLTIIDQTSRLVIGKILREILRVEVEEEEGN
jgi:hypothetical protein